MVGDITGSQFSTKFVIWPTEDTGSLVFDFTNCPREFIGTDYGITSTFNFPAGSYISVQIYGWDETK